MQILIATSNPHKLEEIRAVIKDPNYELVSLEALPGEIDEPVEDQETFEDNAILKARYYAKASGMLCLADDSGLEVDALNGEPGVRSARYSNSDGPRAERDAANSLALLKNLGDTPIEKRTARFVCAMAMVDSRRSSDRPLAVVRGTLEGRILTINETDDPAHPERGRGSNGFGYDPIFYVPELNKTVAELTPREKSDISHRGHAVLNLMFHFAPLLMRNWLKIFPSKTTSVKRDYTHDFLRDFMDAALTDHAKARKILKDYPGLRDTNVSLGETPLHFLSLEENTESVDFLAREGFDVNTKNDLGDTPLMDAANYGESEIAEALLRHGADPNARSTHHRCALYCAIRSEKPKLIKLLLDHGASTSHLESWLGSWGESVSDILQELESNRSEIEQLLRDAENTKSID